MDRDTRRAWAYLSRVAEPPCPELAELVTAHGVVAVAERVRRGEVPESLARRTEARRDIDCSAEDLDRVERLGGRLVTADDDEWPLLRFVAFDTVDTAKRPTAHAPQALWVIGPARLDEAAERSAAIVGTRAATTYGQHVRGVRMLPDYAVTRTHRDLHPHQQRPGRREPGRQAPGAEVPRAG